MSKGREGRSEKIGKRRERGAGGECWGRGERGDRDVMARLERGG